MAAEQDSPETSDDQRLIGAFEPAMLSLLPSGRAPVQAETLLALCLADGVLEVLEWAREGTGADPAASMWLASLRWYRLIAGEFPAGAPQPQPRPTDFALRRIKEAGALDIVPGSAEESLAGLDSAEMNLLPKRREAGDEVPDGAALDNAELNNAMRDNAVLTRVVPIGLAPYVELEMKQEWAAQAVYLTHQDPELVARARRLAGELHGTGQDVRVPQGDGDAELPTEIDNTHLHCRSNSQTGGINGDGGRNELLTVVVEDLAKRWRSATS